jgi:hypothetical protein
MLSKIDQQIRKRLRAIKFYMIYDHRQDASRGAVEEPHIARLNRTGNVLMIGA